MHLLIVDDSETSRLLLETVLRGEGFSNVSGAASWAEALEMLRDAPEEELPDALLMDLEMPDVNGIEATRRFKAENRFADIPVIMITASDRLEDLEEAFAAGAGDFITKPVHRVELRARVGSALRLKLEMDNRKSRERQLERMARDLETLSSQDGLTGISNRRQFDKVLEREWQRCARDKSPLTLLMIDIDFFKRYNDALGHIQGDKCLQKVAKAIQSAFRRPGDFLARYGGEEFAALLPDTGQSGGTKVAEGIRAELRKLALAHPDSSVSDLVTVSMGQATVIPLPDHDPASLVAASDESLYRAKAAGRDQICCLDASDSPDAQAKSKI